MRRIGLFGGSFNPVHLGHLLVAQAAIEEIQLESVSFIPAGQSPFKDAGELAPAKERLRMLRLALAGQPRFKLDEQEIARGGISYTIETVRAYVRESSDASFYYLIGSDLAPQLPLWREAEALAGLIEFVVIPRPGESSVRAPAPFRSHPLRGFPLGVSSSKIRERVKAGLPIEFLVPSAVAEAVAQAGLYL